MNILKGLKNPSSSLEDKIPKSVQKSVPVSRIWQDGIFQSGSYFTKTFVIDDINYEAATKEEQLKYFRGYCDLLNAIGTDCHCKITMNNHVIDENLLMGFVEIPYSGDGMNQYRKEFNDMLMDKVAMTDGIIPERYITVSVIKQNVDEARRYFAKFREDMFRHLHRIGSNIEELSAWDRLEILHDFYRPDEIGGFQFDMQEDMKRGHSFKDSICPNSLEFHRDYFQMGNKFGRVLYLQKFANRLSDKFVSEIMGGINRNMMLSIDFDTLHTDKAIDLIERKMLGVESSIATYKRKQMSNDNYGAYVPYDLSLNREEALEYLKDINEDDERMMLCTISMVHIANSKEQLDLDTDSIITTARTRLCQVAPLPFEYQQMTGLNTVLPYGLCDINAVRTLTTKNVGVLMPFKTKEFYDKGGLYFGQNALSHNLITIDLEKRVINSNIMVMGMTGGGKSFKMKEIITQVAMSSNDQIAVIDPENEYQGLIRQLGGASVPIGSSSKAHINPMEMDKHYGDDDDPIQTKSELILSIFEQISGENVLDGGDKSIIDRCVKETYMDYIRNGYQGEPPTLLDLYRRLVVMGKTEAKAKELALNLELYTKGSMNMFAYKSNVDLSNRIINFETSRLGEQQKIIGTLIILDNVLNRVMENRGSGRRIWVFFDELHLLLRAPYTATFLSKLWVRIRKNGGMCVGSIQSLAQCRNDTSETMINNSAFVIMLAQSKDDLYELTDKYHLSEMQQKYLDNSVAGQGLLKVGNDIVPFIDQFPTNTALYRLMSTKPREFAGGVF